MKSLKIGQKAQSILEYVIILTAIVAAIIFGTQFIKNSLIGKDVTKLEEIETKGSTSLFGRLGNLITKSTGTLPGAKLEVKKP